MLSIRLSSSCLTLELKFAGQAGRKGRQIQSRERKNKLKPQGQPGAHEDELKSVSVPAASELDVKGILQKLHPSSQSKTHAPGPGVREAEKDPE